MMFKEYIYANCSSIKDVYIKLNQLQEVNYDGPDISFTVCTEYDDTVTKLTDTWFYIIIDPVSNIFVEESENYKNYTNGNLLYLLENLKNEAV